MKRIKLHGEEYVFTGDSIEDLDNAITKEDDYEHGKVSYAHLFEDGIIRRHNVQIGTAEDIEVLRDYVPDLKDDCFENLIGGFFGGSWGGAS